MKRPTFNQITHLLACLVIMAGAAMLISGHFFGNDLSREVAPSNSQDEIVTPDNKRVINTLKLGEEIKGYNGTTPVKVTISEGKVESVEALDNTETPSFFKRAAVILDSWNGLSVEEALEKEVDGVTGATFTSKSLIENTHAALQYAASHQTEFNASRAPFGMKEIVALLVVVMGAVIPLIIQDKRYRIAQMILNVAILGFWTCTFINYTRMLGDLSYGFALPGSITMIVMLITAFIYPLFGKRQHYCSHICPLGSLQQLASMCNKRKWNPGAGTVKALNWFRNILWAVLTGLLYLGVATSWIDYEPFTAFALNFEYPAVIIIAAVVVALSVIVNRPYCRFVCPTGTLFKVAET